MIINDERIVQGQSLDEEFEISNNDDDDNNDNDDDDDDNDDDSPLERLGRLVN
ncbi:MAG TPA: hypothetical protein VE544_01475 [Nitrososphaeraceae archaeon]|nr:hypothetical protein [Nitrososphaeraceae archaeon]